MAKNWQIRGFESDRHARRFRIATVFSTEEAGGQIVILQAVQHTWCR